MFVLQVVTIQDYSLGAQWKKHAQTLDNFIRKNISVKVYNTAKMNVDLKVIAI
jgi:hypothetical protein